MLTETFVEVLNAFIFKYGLKLSQNDRIEGLLRRICGEIKNKRKKLRGRANQEFMHQCKHITIFEHEIVKACEVEEQVSKAGEQVKQLSKENIDLKTRCEDLSTEIGMLKESNMKTDQVLKEKEKECDTILDENKELRHYIEESGFFMGVENAGKEITEVGKRQQHRKLKELKTSVERNLWFAESFGLTLESTTFTDKNATNYTFSHTTPSHGKMYKDLSEREKSRVEEILYIVDQFCIGEAAYHELTMAPAGAGLPRSYLIKQCKESLNAVGKAEGAQLNFYETLCVEIEKHVS